MYAFKCQLSTLDPHLQYSATIYISTKPDQGLLKTDKLRGN